MKSNAAHERSNMLDFSAEEAMQTLTESVLRAYRDLPAPVIVGIHTGGAWVAERLRRTLGVAAPISTLDIGFYRDDLALSGFKGVGSSSLNDSIDGRSVLLVDDVLHSGRTIRAALGALFDYGRPAHVRLACLLVREGRELPIQADYFGREVRLDPSQRLKLRGPEPLTLEIL